jgi:hypothetical protein
MSYQFTDAGLTEAITRFADSQAADELFIAMAFLERFTNSLKTEDDIVAGADTVLAFTTKISALRERFNRGLIDQKIYLHRDSLPKAISIVANAVSQVIKPLDPQGRLMDQVVVLIQKGFDEAVEVLDGTTTETKS